MRLVQMSFTIAILFAAGFLPSLAKHGGEGGGGHDREGSSTTSPPKISSSLSTSQNLSPLSNAATVTTTTTTTSTIASPSAFVFDAPSNTTTCQSTTLRWNVSNTLTMPITLTVTNGDRALSLGPSDPSTVLVSRTLTTTVPASAHEFTWAAVDVPQGMYVALAVDTARTAGVFAQSAPFAVAPGPDDSCVSAAAAAGDAGSSFSSSFSFTLSSGSTSSAPSSSLSSATPSLSTSSPGPVDIQQKRLSPGVLGGVVVGVVVGVIILILVFTFPLYRKQIFLRRAQSRRPGGPYYLF